jgi:hypothetical protein
MSPTGVFATLLLALLIDWASIGPDSVRDRVAFCLGLAAIRVGWNGSPVDRYTVDLLTAWINEAKQSGNATLAQASTSALLGVLVAILALYCVGVLLPAKASAKLGHFALLTFSKRAAAVGGAGPAGAGRLAKYRLNLRLWACAWLLGMMAELPGGLIGRLVLGAIDGLIRVVAPLPNMLFGVS